MRMSQKQVHAIKQHIPAGYFPGLQNFNVEEFESLDRLGIGFDRSIKWQDMIGSAGMDSLQPLITTASIPVPVQFLQQWLPGFVFTITGARQIDEITGMDIVGSWPDEQIVQGILEPTGLAVPYGDITNVPYSNWNVNYNLRTVVRFELGMTVGKLEEARAGRVRIDSSSIKREGAAIQLEIQRNTIGFFGYNNGANNTYGFLNDPNLPSYGTVPNGVSGFPQWSKKTTQEIVFDVQTAASTLLTQTQNVIDPTKVALTMAVATGSVTYLNTPNTTVGYSALKYIKDNYPGLRVVSAPQLNAANGGANVFYLFADEVQDGISSDNRRTFMQMVPSKFQMLGVEQKAKSYLEDYSNATAGMLCKRPLAVTRFSGI